MWQYTTETIINSDKGKLNGLCFVTDADGQGSLLIDGVNHFIPKFVTAISKCEYKAAVSEVATLTVPTVTAGETLRLSVTLKEVGQVSSIMQNAYLKHTKPFHYEVVATGTPATDAAALVKLINKDMALTDFPFFKASATGAVITFTADNCHIRFEEIQLVTVGTAGVGTAAALLGFQDYTEVATGTVTTTGELGQGTVEHLVKDLRIPTKANLDPFGPNMGGRPVPGGEYDQYLIEYTTPRRHMGTSVMGSVGESSMTSHVLFVEKNNASQLEAAIEALATAAGTTVDVLTTGVITTPAYTPGSVQ